MTPSYPDTGVLFAPCLELNHEWVKQYHFKPKNSYEYIRQFNIEL